MDDVPELTRPEISELLKGVVASGRKRFLVAIYGQAPAPDTVPELDYRVVPVRSELDLREQMPALDEEPRIAFLVPWSTEIPIDLAGRFAKNGRVLRADPDVRLRALFGARELEDGVARSLLARYLLHRQRHRAYHCPHGKLTLEQLWSTWLRSDWRAADDADLALDTLLAWAARDDRGGRFVEAMQAPDAAGVRDALLQHLTARFGPAAALVWRAWELGRAEEVLQYAAIFEPLRGHEDVGVRTWIKAELKHGFQILDEDAALAIANDLGAAAPQALRLFEQSVGPQPIRALLRAADERAAASEIRGALVESTRLPSAWRARLDQLGQALQAGTAAPTPEAVANAVQALRRLESHSAFRERGETRTVQRADMAVRLFAWLAERGDQRLPAGSASYAVMESLARWYADEGGFVDRARHAARGPNDGPLGQGVSAVVAAADAARVELDQRFAKALASWHHAGRPSTEVLPIEDSVKRIAAKFLSGDDSRRLLVLLIDGMAWAQAVEILESLGERGGGWGPLAWHRERNNRVGGGFYPPMIAALPTITEVSRAAFFAGKPPKPHTTGSTSDDPKRWLENASIKPYLTNPVANELLLRPDGHSLDGNASPEALSRVQDPNRRVVAMVINAIDSALKGDVQHAANWRAENIRSLLDLLQKAKEAQRSVLLVADHGHVPADRLSNVGQGSSGGGARWRPWASSDEALLECELGFAGGAIGSPRGAHGVVLLTDDASRYRGAPTAGEHGGATLAEVVAPCILIGSEDNAQGLNDDKALKVLRQYEPAWWHPSEVVIPERPVIEPPVEVPAVEPPAPKPGQLTLPVVAPPPTPTPPKASRPPEPSGPDLTSALAQSELLAARAPAKALREQYVHAVQFLHARSGVASSDALARELNLPNYRIGGFLSHLREALNVEGYEVVRYDAVAKQVHLDAEKLQQQFEVKL